MNTTTGYIFLALAIILGIFANGYVKVTDGFTKLIPTVACVIAIVTCLFCLSRANLVLPVSFTYATYGGLTITAVTVFGILKYNQIPNVYALIGITLIIVGVILLNYFGKINS